MRSLKDVLNHELGVNVHNSERCQKAVITAVCLLPVRQGKSLRMPSSSLPPYDNMTEESDFNNPVYETVVSTDVMHLQDVDSYNTIVLS